MGRSKVMLNLAKASKYLITSLRFTEQTQQVSYNLAKHWFRQSGTKQLNYLILYENKNETMK